MQPSEALLATDGRTAVLLVIANFISWGHWPICAKCATAPSQPFGVLMVVAQTLCALLACGAHGAAFFTTLVSDSQNVLAVLSVVLGGGALAVGDFAAAAAIERLGVAVGGPVCFSCMLVCGAVGDFLLEGSTNPLLLFAGVLGCMAAVIADSKSHPEHAANERVELTSADGAAAVAAASLPQVSATMATMELGSPELPEAADAAAKNDAQPPVSSSSSSPGSSRSFRIGMRVAIGGGCVGGMWTVLSTLASHVHELQPLSLLFYFHLGEAAFIVPVVLGYGRLFNGATSLKELGGLLRGLTRRQVAWTVAAGACIAIGYLTYFATIGAVPRPVAFGFGCAAGSTGMLYGLCVFHEYKGATRRHKCMLLLAFCLYPSSIALIALSMA